MKALKYTSLAFILAVSATGLIACGSKKEKKTRTNYTLGEGVQVVDGASFDGQGYIIGYKLVDQNNRIIDEQSQTEFQEAAEDLISNLLGEESLGEVSKEQNASTGIRFSANLSLQSGQLDLQRLDSSRKLLKVDQDFEIQIRDSKAAQGEEYEGVHILFSRDHLMNSFVEGNRVSILLGNSNSPLKLNFEGEINNENGQSITEGNVYYRNDATAKSGTLGYFRVSTCQFISARNCQ